MVVRMHYVLDLRRDRESGLLESGAVGMVCGGMGGGVSSGGVNECCGR